MRKIEKAMEMIVEWDYDQRHQLSLEADDKGMTLRELVIKRYCPRDFGIESDCPFLECWDCWLLEEG